MNTVVETSIATSFRYDLPLEAQIPLIAGAGFSHVSIGAKPEHSRYLDRIRRTELRTRLADQGLAVDSVHARRLDATDAVSEASATAAAAAEMGAACVVAHAGPFFCTADGIEERLRSVLATCRTLTSVARGSGVVFALENVMPGPATDLVRRALQDLDPAVFGLCYDSSHDQIDGPRPFDLIREFKGRIVAVHLSDRIRENIDHVIPGEGFINWPAMCKALRDAAFSGPALMEVMMTHSRFTESAEFLREAHRSAVDTWRRIHDRETTTSKE